MRALFWFAMTLVLINAMLVFIAMQKRKRYMSQPVGAGEVNAVAVLGGDQRTFYSDAFRGGYVRAMMGGVELDLSQARVESPPAVLDTEIFMGGADIKVPSDWKVKNEAKLVMGGADIRGDTNGAEPPDLLVTGRVVMGGLSIRRA